MKTIKKGEWIYNGIPCMTGYGLYRCGVCNYDFGAKYNFCPNCGDRKNKKVSETNDRI